MTLEQKLLAQLTEKLKDVDDKAKELILSGNLQNFSEVRFSYGYRKGLADALKLLNETFEDIMKE